MQNPTPEGRPERPSPGKGYFSYAFKLNKYIFCSLRIPPPSSGSPQGVAYGVKNLEPFALN